MNFDRGQVLACFMALFAVINIIGSIPLILEIKNMHQLSLSNA